ncbi:hypothetical protein [Methylobacterium sp.]|uniref:hypothetical protein n=1 Tax=Methylobacterium sp. TaxID=409 RepID=UPI003B000B07
MRLIFSALAVWQIRLARFDLARSDMLLSDAEAAQDRAQQRLLQADAYARRSVLPLPPTIRR